MASIPEISGLLLTEDSGAIVRVLRILEQTAGQRPAERAAQQLAQLEGIVRLARLGTPHGRERLPASLGEGPLTWERFRSIPLLTRAELQAQGERLELSRPPPGLKVTGSTTTSGSTGMPVTSKSTWGLGVMTRALGLRMQRAHGFDLDAPAAFITTPTPPGAADPPLGRKGGPWAAPAGSGPSLQLDLLASTDAQLDWLGSQRPPHLATYPSNLQALLMRSRERGLAPPGVRLIALSSEPIGEELLRLAADVWGARVVATYSANEVGAIAFSATDGQDLVVQSENVLVEVLRDDGSACEPGEVGRVVLTTLQDMLRPLIRYEIGDYAEVAPARPDSPVTLPRLRRVLGRERTMIRLPDGRRVWPHFEFEPLLRLGCLRRWQLVQKSDLSIEVRVVPLSSGGLDEVARTAIGDVVRAALPGVEARVVEVAEIERGARGKYLELISELG
ncbi:MAG TPA: hypothetical protein VLC09_19975 [Polyangiaceae bacterium]|nr:hypothetical protein [Polyangiaceae bacterium]